MSTFQKCPADVKDLAADVLTSFDSYKPLLDAKVKVDYLFAFSDENEDGEPTGPAIMHHGLPSLGVARVVSLKDRVKGMGDCEVLLDGNWWEDAPEDKRRALLDHELHHFLPKLDKGGVQITDDFGRPKLAIRKHDYEFGWFTVVAERNGAASLERLQAAKIAEEAGQFYWPSLSGQLDIKA